MSPLSKGLTMKKNVIFDLGGVLFNWNPKEIVHILKKEEELFPDNIHEAMTYQAWKNFDAGILTLEQTIEDLSQFHARSHIEKFIKLSLEKLEPIKEGVSLLEEVQRLGHSTYILSNISKDFIDRLLKKHAFLKTFDGYLYSYEIQVVKPDPRIYQYLLDRYQLDPKDCLFIDDSPLNVSSANDIGIKSILCDNHKNISEKLFCYLEN
jgi:HAD superfamily hydrolase (TIGR01509 family)